MKERGAPVTARDERTAMSGGGIVVVFVGVLLTMLMGALDQTVVTTAAWPIVRDLDPAGGLDGMSWIVVSYMLASTATQPIYGKLADLLGAKKVYVTAVVLFLVGSALCGAAQNMGELIAFRALQGVGAGGLYSVALVVIGLMTTPQQRAKFQGVGGAVIGLSTVVGPLIGGYFTESHDILGITTNWRWLFYVNLPLGALALGVVVLLLRIPVRRTNQQIDFIGAALIVAAACSVLLVTEWGGDTYAWSSPTIITMSVAAVLLSVAFVRRQRRAADPLIPLRLFKDRTVALSIPILFLVGFALIGSIVHVSMYLQVVYGYTPTQAGSRMLPMTVGFMISAIGSGIIVSKFGRYKAFPILGSVFSAGGLALLGTMDPDTSVTLLCTYIFLIGLGVGLLMQLMVLVVQNAVPRTDLGVATTTSTFFRTLGQSFGAALFGAILSARLNSTTGGAHLGNLGALPEASRHTYLVQYTDAATDVFLIAGAIMLIAAVLGLFLREMNLEELEDDPAVDEGQAGGQPAGPAAAPDAGSLPASAELPAQTGRPAVGTGPDSR
ncbi:MULTISPECIES: MDR family MFS transporter [Streptomyces]|uniref:MDR family MFS transporter n=1 Tax=Streptomyces TaxID=1883 RepID=UPI001921F352|nr:MDR family MFS transporter [Streptomyces spororaveus]